MKTIYDVINECGKDLVIEAHKIDERVVSSQDCYNMLRDMEVKNFTETQAFLESLTDESVKSVINKTLKYIFGRTEVKDKKPKDKKPKDPNRIGSKKIQKMIRKDYNSPKNRLKRAGQAAKQLAHKVIKKLPHRKPTSHSLTKTPRSSHMPK